MVDHTRLRLIDLDPDLAAAVPSGELAAARREAVGIRFDLPAGTWDHDELLARLPSCHGMLVVYGLMAREVVIEGRASRQLFGAGDLLLEGPTPEEQFFDVHVAWRVLEPLRLALLGDSWLRATGRWPSLGTELLRRAGDQSARLAVHQAICHLPRVEERVQALFMHLAVRWGHVTADGVILPMRLTHEEIGRLIGARRSTVTLALGELEDLGTLARQPDGTWRMQTNQPLGQATPARVDPAAAG